MEYLNLVSAFLANLDHRIYDIMADGSAWGAWLPFRSSVHTIPTPPQSDDNMFEKAPTSDRPGKFEFPWDFVQVDSEDRSLRKGYKKLEAIGAIPGLIVHVLDESAENEHSGNRSRNNLQFLLTNTDSRLAGLCNIS